MTLDCIHQLMQPCVNNYNKFKTSLIYLKCNLLIKMILCLLLRALNIIGRNFFKTVPQESKI